MNKYLSKCFDVYNLSLSSELATKTLVDKRREISYFLEYLSNQSIVDLNSLNSTFIYHYVASRKVSSNTRSGICFKIREFFNIMYSNNICEYDGYKLYPVVFSNKRNCLPSYYQPDEIKKLINSVDTSTKFGIRNKCFILLAAQTGLRRSDIIDLKFDEILWDKNIISKVQQKTKNPIIVPLPKNIKYTLIDYIKNHRPKSSSNYIFINPKNNKKYTPAELYVVIEYYLKKTDININNRKRGSHALRHSLASNLLALNTPMPVITGILGHKNLNTTSRYLTIDIETLRSLCLEVPEYD